MAAERKLVRIQEKGQVTLPADIRKRLGLIKGDLVAVEGTPEGVMITPQGVLALEALEEIGKALKEQGLTLEEMIESGREERDELLRELYGIDPPDEPDQELRRHVRWKHLLFQAARIQGTFWVIVETPEAVLKRLGYDNHSGSGSPWGAGGSSQGFPVLALRYGRTPNREFLLYERVRSQCVHEFWRIDVTARVLGIHMKDAIQ
jgi:AbrB family looped-hinge helix DNA binding protein